MNILTKARLRRLHFQLAPIMILPLLLTVITGVLFQIADLTGNTKDFRWLLKAHIGNFGSIHLDKIYPFFNGLGVLVLGITGIMIWLQTPRRRQKD